MSRNPLRSLVPMAHVRSVPRSIEFYRRLGFQVENTFVPAGQEEPSWAGVESENARLMIARAGETGETVVPSQQAVLFYIYCDDIAGKHAELESAGLAGGSIERPFHAPRGEFRVEDPDGYVLMFTHTQSSA